MVAVNKIVSLRVPLIFVFNALVLRTTLRISKSSVTGCYWVKTLQKSQSLHASRFLSLPVALPKRTKSNDTRNPGIIQDMDIISIPSIPSTEQSEQNQSVLCFCSGFIKSRLLTAQHRALSKFFSKLSCQKDMTFSLFYYLQILFSQTITNSLKSHYKTTDYVPTHYNPHTVIETKSYIQQIYSTLLAALS